MKHDHGSDTVSDLEAMCEKWESIAHWMEEVTGKSQEAKVLRKCIHELELKIKKINGRTNGKRL